MATSQLSRHLRALIARHTLFLYARDSFRLFTNLYLFETSDGDLQLVAIFNILFLVFHTAAFPLCAGPVKKGRGTGNLVSALLGLAATMTTVLLLGEETAQWYVPLGIVFGFFNGQYWIVAHAESLDATDESNRATFFSYRQSLRLATAVLMPAIAWTIFATTSNDALAYQMIFALAIAAILSALFFAKVTMKTSETFLLRQTWQTLRKTPGFLALGGYSTISTAVVRGAIVTPLLPFLLVDLLEGTTQFTMVETITQCSVILISVTFARYQKNADRIVSMGYVALFLIATGLFMLFFEASLFTYGLYLVLNITGASAMAISWSTISYNFVSHTPTIAQQDVEYIVIREFFGLSGYTATFVFLYFFDSLTLEALRPLLFTLLLGLVVSGLLYKRLVKAFAI